jgi:hypothetical protein
MTTVSFALQSQQCTQKWLDKKGIIDKNGMI